MGRHPAEHTREVTGNADEKGISIIKAVAKTCIKTSGLSEKNK